MDDDIRKKFATFDTYTAKQKERRVKLRHNWEIVKFTVMLEICRAKFTQNTKLDEQLFVTGEEKLIESNTL